MVAPGADPRRIELDFDGISGFRIDSSGALVLQAGSEELRQQKPTIYQDVSGVRRFVNGRYVRKGRRISFAIARYDLTRPLVIDPTLRYATYLGGTKRWTNIYGIAVDSSGNAYVTGNAPSDFPITPGTYQATGGSIFIAKLNATGTGLVYSTFVGLNNGDGLGTRIAVDSGGNAFVIGSYPGNGFPTTGNAFRPSSAGAGFFLKLSAAGNSLLYSTYIGGLANALVIDGSGNVYIGGTWTAASGLDTTAGAYQSNPPNVNSTAFVSKINTNASGTASLVYSSYFGGSVNDTGNGVGVDSSGYVYLAGNSQSTNLPTTPGVYQTSFKGGGSDGFVAKFNPAASGTSSLVYCTYLGGSGYDQATAIAVDPLGFAYVTGYTDSNDFPVTPTAYQTTNKASASGQHAGWVAKLNATAGLVFSTYLSGSSGSAPVAIAIDSAGNSYVAGGTYSYDFPTTSGTIQPALKSANSTP